MGSGLVFVAAIASSACLMALVFWGLHADRAQIERGEAPWWVLLSGLGIAAGLAALYVTRDSSPFAAAFSAAMLGTFLGGGVTFLALRWLGRRGR